MSSNADHQKRLEEIQRRRKEMDARMEALKKNREAADARRIGQPQDSAPTQTQGLAKPAPAPAKPSGPVIEVSNFVGVFNMPAKQKAYMYDRAVEVTKEQIRLLQELQEEEKPTYNPKDEDKDQDEDKYAEKKKEKKANILPDEEVEKIMNKAQFKRFVRKGSGILEQELSDTESLYDDLIQRNDVGVDGEKTMVNFSFNFMDESVKGYTVTNLVWCRTNADLVLVTYNTNDITEKYPTKLLVWSMKTKLKPLHIMNSEKKITRAIFHPRDEKLIYAATYSGNLMQYKCGAVAPVLKNFNAGENGEFHASPVFILEFYFKENSEFLVSISDDGKLCIWNVNFLYEPVVNRVLEMPPRRDTSRIKLQSVQAMTSVMVNPFSEEALLAVSTQDALIIIYKVSSFFTVGEEPMANFVSTEHHGPICSLSYKSDPTRPFLQDMYLTASFDFDMQLIKATESTSAVIKKFPLHSDYVVAVEWNPVHPAMFASCDCNGKFLIFDLVTSPNYFSYEGEAAPATTMRWSPDGMKLAFGCLNGNVQIWQMRKKYLKCDDEKLAAVKYEFV